MIRQLRTRSPLPHLRRPPGALPYPREPAGLSSEGAKCDRSEYRVQASQNAESVCARAQAPRSARIPEDSHLSDRYTNTMYNTGIGASAPRDKAARGPEAQKQSVWPMRRPRAGGSVDSAGGVFGFAGFGCGRRRMPRLAGRRLPPASAFSRFGHQPVPRTRGLCNCPARRRRARRRTRGTRPRPRRLRLPA